MADMDAARQAATIGAQVRRARKANDWTGKQLAAAAGVSPGTVVSIENGRPTRPGNLTAVLNALNIPPISETERTIDEDVSLALDIVEKTLSSMDPERRRAEVRALIRYMTLRESATD